MMIERALPLTLALTFPLTLLNFPNAGIHHQLQYNYKKLIDPYKFYTFIVGEIQ
jgi:hypothetical protein